MSRDQDFRYHFPKIYIIIIIILENSKFRLGGRRDNMNIYQYSKLFNFSKVMLRSQIVLLRQNVWNSQNQNVKIKKTTKDFSSWKTNVTNSSYQRIALTRSRSVDLRQKNSSLSRKNATSRMSRKLMCDDTARNCSFVYSSFLDVEKYMSSWLLLMALNFLNIINIKSLKKSKTKTWTSVFPN